MSWRIGEQPEPGHLQAVRDAPLLFADPAWSVPLAALGARSLYGWHEPTGTPMLIPVFRLARWIPVGFLGFPVTGEPFDRLPAPEREGLAAAILARGLKLLRLTRSAVPTLDPEADGVRPDVWIEDPRSWSPDRRLRRDLQFARKALAEFEMVEGGLDGAACHRLYQAALARHAAEPTYGEPYFRALAALLATHPAAAGFGLRDRDGNLRAFAVLAVHGGSGYYLHAAADERARRLGGGDLLLARIVEEAARRGLKRLVLMASPWSQPGLLRFKRKWGNRLGWSLTWHRAQGALGVLLRALARLRLSADRRAAGRGPSPGPAA